MPGSSDARRAQAVFKAYDIRGRVPEELDALVASNTGAAFVAETGADTVLVGHDMRASSPDVVSAFAAGVLDAGADVVHLGLCSTDQLYFASGTLDLPGAMVTASHNPAGYNGLKLCRAGAVPVGRGTGLDAIQDRVARGERPQGTRAGTTRRRDLLDAYADHLVALTPVAGRPLRVVADAGNGMAGHTAPAVFERLPDVELVPMYFELDGSFPHHEANPIDPATLVDLQERVVAEGADVGLAFDGDADRCFLVDERGRVVPPSVLTALIAARELEREPGATVIHNLITGRAVPELVTRLGGTPVRTRVGHSFIKATMAQTGAVFGGEHSGHFYFRDFWRADSGMLAALHALAALAGSAGTLSELLAEHDRYAASGEVNSTVADPARVVAAVRAAYDGRDGVSLDDLDGLSADHDDWWFNVRPSNTEPLLRLNVEGRDTATMERVRDDVLALIRSPGGKPA